jgi:uncharacterized protein YqjF (DUF2071 family)
VEPCAAYSPDELSERDHSITARYCLYTLVRGQLKRAQIEHAPWPLARATLLVSNQTLIEATGLSRPHGAPLVHYSPKITVKIGYPRML